MERSDLLNRGCTAKLVVSDKRSLDKGQKVLDTRGSRKQPRASVVTDVPVSGHRSVTASIYGRTRPGTDWAFRKQTFPKPNESHLLNIQPNGSLVDRNKVTCRI